MNSIFLRQQVLCIIAYPVHFRMAVGHQQSHVTFKYMKYCCTAASIVFILFSRF